MRHLCRSATLGTTSTTTTITASLATTAITAATLTLVPIPLATSFGPAPLVGVLRRCDMQLHSGGNTGRRPVVSK